MWYFAWVLGLGFAVALGIINVMWLESNYAFGLRSEEETKDRFVNAEKARKALKHPPVQEQ